MSGITITTRVRQDWKLTIPKKIRESLGLHEGDEVEVTVSKSINSPLKQDRNLLLNLIGIAKGGPTDGAEDHDSRLYRHPTL